MNKLSVVLLCINFLFFSCADKYMSFKNKYDFKSTTGIPDYSNLDYWAAHPWKWDPSDSIPQPLTYEVRDSIADVFFLYPTTYTAKKNAVPDNAAIDDAYINAKTDYSSILYQASVFNQHCRVFSPRYRQAHIRTFFEAADKADPIFDTAYADIRRAFQFYLENYNQGRPIIIAGHSQGAKMAERLLKDFFDGKPLQKQLVAAYIIGWPVPDTIFTSIKICNDSLQTGCACSWRTLRKNYLPSHIKNEKQTILVTNPLSWTTSEGLVPRKYNDGSVLYKFNKLYKHTTEAKISHGVVWVKKPRFPWSFLYFSKNYHPGDINLYYMNMRENIAERIQSFLNRQ
ncbi:MAG: DUF3089 domain-containing protein [Bacteroidetes bacterium]|nr:DUF3089 domain-containing protein [Bacteroidota bacterium]